MKHVLICTIGNRDIVLDDPNMWPPQLHDSQAGARERGAYLFDHGSELHEYIRLPIIEKALRHVQQAVRQHQADKLDGLVLVVSDQPESARAEFRSKDTVEFGRVIQTYLPQHRTWRTLIIKKHIRLLTVDSNPADFDNMRFFFDQELPKIRTVFGNDATYYLAISGGTPAMTAMLLFVGSAVFGKMCTPLYVSDALEAALPLEASQQIYQQSLRSAILTSIRSHSYAAADRLLRDNVDDPIHVVDSRAAQETIPALLRYAHQRLAFDFAAAQATLEPIVGKLRGPHRDQIVGLWNDTAHLAQNDALKLRDVYYGVKIKYEHGEYADFLGRVFRFHEGILRWLAQQWGVEFSGRKLDAAWLAAQPALQQHLATYRSNPVDPARDVTRYALRALAAFFAPQHGAEMLLAHLDSIEKLANLRNQTIIAHNFQGVSKHVLAQAFTADPRALASEADRIVPTLATIYELAVGRPVGANPFDQINQLLETLLNEAR